VKLDEMKQSMKAVILFGGLFSLLPIWRAAGHEGGMNFWSYIFYMGSDEHRQLHIPYNNALSEARNVWESKHGNE